jgi:hypothetical protein
MREIIDIVNGDVIIPMPELDASEKPAVANLLAQGVDTLAIRTSSVLPDLRFPPTGKTEAELQRSHDAREAELAIWDQNNMDVKFGRSARHYHALGSTTFMVKPVSANHWDKRQIPHFHVVHPLHTYPAPSSDPDCFEPRDIIIHKRQTLAWLRARYPEQAARVFKGRNARPDMEFDILEYNDADQTCLVLVGQKRGQYDHGDYEQGISACELLEWLPNPAGICLAVTGGRITLDRIAGHFDQIAGLYLNQAQLQAYELIAVRKGIFPEQWVVSHPNAPGEARILALADGKQGDIGEIANGTILTVTPQANQMTSVAIDRLQGESMRAAAIPSETGGVSGTNIRTAKRGQEVMQSAMDPIIGESQTVYSHIFQAMNERGMAVQKSEWGSKSISFYQSKSGKNVGTDTYKPNDVFDSDYHIVVFSLPGVDAAGIPIEIGQRLGTKVMSLRTARASDPMIDDGEAEGVQVDIESLENAMMAGFEAQLQNGAMDPHEVAMIVLRRQAHPEEDLAAVVMQVQKDLQAAQAAQAQQAPPPGAPETQPGMGQGQTGGMQAPGAPGPPQQVGDLLNALRPPAKQSPAEMQLAGTAPAPQGP